MGSLPTGPIRRATGPGRVNLVGDHTDYNDGVALPIAVDLGVSVQWEPAPAGSSGANRLTVVSTAFEERVELPVGPEGTVDPAAVEPRWAGLVAAMAGLVPGPVGGTLRIDGSLPIGAGLSSSAALTVALAEVFGAEGSPASVASLCREAEHRCGIPVGMMDPLVCVGARAGHALLIDFATMTTTQVPLPTGAEIVVVDSGQHRALVDTPYGVRVRECRSAAAIIGPLGLATGADLAAVGDPILHRRCRHVVTECARVRKAAEAFRSGELERAGAIMAESHRSLSRDFEVSTPAIDSLVEQLSAAPGVFGARLTGGGFGGSVVALSRPGALDLGRLTTPAWRVVAADGTAARRPAAAPGRS